MDQSYDFLEELEEFLGGTFHQDINSPELALGEFIKDSSKECLQFTVKYCEEVLRSELTIHEKEKFIQNNVDIYFPAIELTPLQWLIQLVELMKEAVK